MGRTGWLGDCRGGGGGGGVGSEALRWKLGRCLVRDWRPLLVHKSLIVHYVIPSFSPLIIKRVKRRLGVSVSQAGAYEWRESKQRRGDTAARRGADTAALLTSDEACNFSPYIRACKHLLDFGEEEVDRGCRLFRRTTFPLLSRRRRPQSCSRASATHLRSGLGQERVRHRTFPVAGGR